MKYIRFAVNNIDSIAGIVGAFLGILIISLYYIINLQQRDIGFTIFTTSLIYLFLRNKFKTSTIAFRQFTRQEKFIINILFFSIFFITLLIWWMQLYHRPLIYFVLISILTALIAIEILYFKEGDSVWPILLQIFLLSVNIRAGIFYNFPSIMGYDAYWHMMIAESITNTGFVAPIEISNKYFYYPIFHIFVSISQTFIDLNIKDAAFYSIGITSIVATIFVYIICMKIQTGVRVALLATLLVNITNFIIVRGITNVTPGSFVLCYLLVIIYLLFTEYKSIIANVLIIFMTCLMVITHQLSTFVALIILFSVLCSKYTYKIIHGGNNCIINISPTYILFFVVVLLSYWMNTYYGQSTSFFGSVIGPLVNTLESGGEYGNNLLIVGQTTQYTLFEISLLHASYLILPFFGIGGMLLWSSLNDYRKLSIVVTVFILYLFIYGVPLLGMRNMLNDRWQPFLAIFLAILASAYIVKIIELIKLNSIKIFATFAIIFILSFFMITTPGINKDNPIIAKETTTRNQYTYSEIYAARTISKISEMPINKIKMDGDYIGCFIYYGSNITSFEAVEYDAFDNDYITSATRNEKGTNTILRKSTSLEPINIKYSNLYGVFKAQLLPIDFFERFMSNNYDKLYDNGDILQYHSK